MSSNDMNTSCFLAGCAYSKKPGLVPTHILFPVSSYLQVLKHSNGCGLLFNIVILSSVRRFKKHVVLVILKYDDLPDL